MALLHRITSVEPLPGYRLRIRFEDGVGGIVDVSELVGEGVFAAWADTDFFAAVAVDDDTGTVVWPDGADLAPDALYHQVSRDPLRSPA